MKFTMCECDRCKRTFREAENDKLFPVKIELPDQTVSGEICAECVIDITGHLTMPREEPKPDLEPKRDPHHPGSGKVELLDGDNEPKELARKERTADVVFGDQRIAVRNLIGDKPIALNRLVAKLGRELHLSIDEIAAGANLNTSDVEMSLAKKPFPYVRSALAQYYGVTIKE